MTIEKIIECYEKMVGVLESDVCRGIALGSTDVQEAVERGISYYELVQEAYLIELVHAYRDSLK